jgi:hypothetical protein
VIVLVYRDPEGDREGGLESIVVSLREAEALRFAIHTGQLPSSFGVCTLSAAWLTSRPPLKKKLNKHACPELLCPRFFNSEMRFRDDEKVNEIIPLVTLLAR